MHYTPAVEDAPKLAEEVNVGSTRIRLETLADRAPGRGFAEQTGARPLVLGSSTWSPNGDAHVAPEVIGQLRPGEVALRLCESILDHSLEVEVEGERRRAPDRAELVADPTLLREESGWQPIYPCAPQLRLG